MMDTAEKQRREKIKKIEERKIKDRQSRIENQGQKIMDRKIICTNKKNIVPLQSITL
jgi:hypothetical protein